MEIQEWFISPFDVEEESANSETFLKEPIEMAFKLEANSMFTFKGIEYF